MDFQQFARKAAKLESDLKRENMRAMLTEIGENAQKIAIREASADLGGDPKFSGWAPPLDTKFRLLDGAVSFSPTKSSAGPWTVATIGRNKGNAGGFAGPAMTRSGGAVGRRKSGGVRSTRARAGKRWNGYTQGKGTADRVVADIERTTTPIVNKGVVRIVRKHFDVN